jgi:hypothetical protein
MSTPIDDLREHVERLEAALEQEIHEARARWKYRIEAGRVRFERDVHLAHRRFKQSVPAFIRESEPRNLLSAPIIYSLIVPLALADLWITLYQVTCFPIYRIAKVRRGAYVVIDRQHLAYLNGIEKLNCMYCGYANGVLAYIREVAARTEQYWCPIRHAKRIQGAHAHYREFVEYGDAKGYKRQLPVLRAELERNRKQNDL